MAHPTLHPPFLPPWVRVQGRGGREVGKWGGGGGWGAGGGGARPGGGGGGGGGVALGAGGMLGPVINVNEVASRLFLPPCFVLEAAGFRQPVAKKGGLEKEELKMVKRNSKWSQLKMGQGLLP